MKKAVLGLTIAALAVGGPTARSARAQAASAITSDFSQLSQLITAASYIDGLGFAVGAILKFKMHKDNPTQVPVGTPIGLVFVAGALLFLPSVLSVAGSTMFGQSCPVFVGSGTLLGEDTCLWGQFNGDSVAQSSSTTQALGWHMGGQYEVAPGWFLGGLLGTGSAWSQAPASPTTNEQAFDAAVVVKRVDGPLYLSGALGISNSAEQNSWQVPIGTGVMSGANTTLGLVGQLRGAYQVQLDPVYVRPRVDLLVGYMSRSGMQESGSTLAITVDPVSKTGMQIKPMLEVGGRADVGSAILRPYVAAGPVVMPDNTLHLSGSVGGTAYAGDIQGSTLMFAAEGGIQVYASKTWDAKLEYRLTTADQFLDQSLNLKVARHF